MKIDVFGTPAPQGSKRHVGNGVMIESSKRVKPWREAVKQAALAAVENCPCGCGESQLRRTDVGLSVAVTFYLARPRSHYGTGRNATTLKPSAPRWPATRPDLDKLIRSTFDALGDAGVWADDSRAVIVFAQKAYADERDPGASITITLAPGAIR